MTPLASDYHNLKAAKGMENAAARQRARTTDADAGPQLVRDGERIRIPSPNYHQKFIEILQERGFRYFGGVLPHWHRDTDKPYQGKTYSPAAWLDWAQVRYAWAWKLEREAQDE